MGPTSGSGPAARAQPPCCPSRSLPHPGFPVSRLILYVNGREAMRLPLRPVRKPTRPVQQIPLTLPRSQDAYVVVRVDGDQVLAPIVGDRSRFDVRPLLLTNPIFLDMNHNGRSTRSTRTGAYAKKNAAGLVAGKQGRQEERSASQSLSAALYAEEQAALHDEDAGVDDIPEAADHHRARAQQESRRAVRLRRQDELP